jgi:hypothetical protein
MLAIEASQGFTTITEEHLASRELSRCAAPYRPMNIYFDLRPLKATLTEIDKADLIPFYEKVFDATGAWWRDAVKVNDDRSKAGPRVQEAWEKFDNWVAPAGFDSTQYDLLIKVQWADEKGNQSTLAWAGPRHRHPASQRPVSGILGIEKYGSDLWEHNTDKKKAFQGAMATMIHEFGHIIAFASWNRYQKKNILSITGTDGMVQYYWKGPKAIEVAKNYYKCSGEFKGLPLQSQSGRLGAHWQEAWFGAEGMSPAEGAEPELFSAMTLALCEDSGWYQVNYAMAENYDFGKGAGCEKKDCSKQACNPETDTGTIVGPKRTFLGYCRKDANGCGVFRGYSNKNCKNEAGWNKGDLDYGANYGDNCTIVKGKFRKVKGQYIWSTSRLVVEATCDDDQSEYSLKFKGAEVIANFEKTGKDVIIACKAAGVVDYNKFSSHSKSSVRCEDPKVFCKARFGGQELCPQMCSNSGRCAHKANTTAGPVDFKTLVKRKMLGGTRTISLADSGSDSVGNGYACWCFKNGGFSTEASGSCPNAL